MTIPAKLQQFLQSNRCQYEIAHHPRSRSSLETARLAHVPSDCLVKSVMVEDSHGPMMTVLPASRRIDLQALYDLTGRRLRLMREAQIARLFEDCDPGAVPAVGSAYGMETMVDDAVTGLSEIWFEAGDHEDVIRMRGGDYAAMMPAARHGSFSRPMA